MSQELTEKLQTQIQPALEEVIDPELGIDIVNLGLVYEVDLSGCPLADVIINDVKQALLKIDQIKEVKVELVWYPAWDPSRMSRYARIALGVKL